MSQISQPKSAVMDNPSNKEKGGSSNRLENSKSYTLKQIRELVFKIRFESKGKLSFKQISRDCGWTSSRLIQILQDFKKYFPKTKKKQDEIWEKLNKRLESVKRETKQGDEQNEESTSGN